MKSIAQILPEFRSQPDRPATCEKHGPYTSKHLFRNIFSKCPECAREADAAEKAVEEAAKREAALRRWQQTIGGSGIPERFHNRTLKNFVATTPEQRAALEFATAYADGFDRVLANGRCALFVGEPGTGKTHLAAGIALRIMRRDQRSVLFSTVMRAIRRVKDSWSRDSQITESQAIASMVAPDLLILDEVGVQFGTDAEKLILFDILNERYEKRRPTLILSNLSVDDVRQFLGERIFDRLREDGGEAVVFNWGSYRGNAK